ncbi:MAG: hypothetical protein GX341_08670 [Firmicutes bacterium]|nr:hypothetical protein [Bacillota bacterium]
MGLLAKLVNKLSSAGQAPRQPGVEVAKDAVWVYIKCDKCGEKLALRLRKSSEIQREEAGRGYQMFINKTVIGNQCFNRMHLRLEFDGAYRVVNKQLQAGTFITKEEYENSAS